MIELVRGNLLKADVEALVNTVNTVGVMGKGIALQFRKAFPENYNSYREACDADEVVPGRMFVFELAGTMLQGPRYIINFPTKRHWRDRTRLDDIASGLNALVTEIDHRGIRSVALPPLGCGSGGLSWTTVYPLIEEALISLEKVRVLVFEPAGAPDPQQMVDRTSRPRMTAGRAAILMLMQRYVDTGWDYRLSLLELQKLAYFLQEAGENLRLRYKALVYGPYADNLRHVLHRIEGHFVTGYGDGRNSPDTPLAPECDAIKQAEAFLADKTGLQERLERVFEVIEGFETPYGMELLSSTHWVAVHGLGDKRARTPDEAADLVRSWNAQKARSMKVPHIHKAWSRLAEQGWI